MTGLRAEVVPSMSSASARKQTSVSISLGDLQADCHHLLLKWIYSKRYVALIAQHKSKQDERGNVYLSRR